MSKYEIRSGLPIPGIVNHHEPRKPKYPWPDMKVGDSFFLAGDKVNGRLVNAGRHWAKTNKNGYAFKGRTVTENGERGVRIWRVA